MTSDLNSETYDDAAAIVKDYEYDHEAGGFVVHEDDEQRVLVCPMFVNHRVVVDLKDGSGLFAAGWCYPTALAAFAAALVWNPREQQEREVQLIAGMYFR